MWRKYCGRISATNRSVSRTANASPDGNHETTEASSFLSMSINLRGNGFEPDVAPDGDAVDESDGDWLLLLLLPMLAVLVILRVAIGPSDASLSFEVETVLAGDVPVWVVVVGLTLITPAATPPAKGKRTAPLLTVDGGVLEVVVLGAFLAFS